MTIRILHTADNHIGMPFKHYPSEVGTRLAEERFAALGRIVDIANERHADFLVIAGDLFDSPRVKAHDIDRTAALLRGFGGTAVIVVPGNHDHHAGPDSELWKRFLRQTESAANIDLLVSPEVKTYDINGQPVHFFPCPCPSKTGRDPTIGWVAEATGNHDHGLRIGVAHGNVPGLGLDAADQYFSMDRSALDSAGVATWLLGHIHVPFPTVEAGETSTIFMAGTHTPDSLRCRHPGSAWWIECEGSQVSRYERLSLGRMRFVRIERELLGSDDVATLVRECRALDAGSTILDLQLTGRLSTAERSELEASIERIRPEFSFVSVESDIHDRLDATQIARLYRSGGLAERLLTSLLADTDHPEAATLAHELIEKASKA
ncbi:MAG: exonuclease SbcCD subunit D [Planctomycetia bacterium]